VPFRLLALDIDGTLLGSDKEISSRTRAAVASARARGVHLVLVTGRRYPAARRVAEELGRDIPLVLHNGALIMEAGAVVRCRPLPSVTAERAVLIGRDHGADAVVHTGQRGEGKLLVERAAPDNTLLAYYLDRSHPDVAVVDDLTRSLGTGEDPLQVMFGGEGALMDSLVPKLVAGLGDGVRLERTRYPSQGVGIVDVLHPEVGKADALEFLQRRWSLSARETLAIGDNWNDHEMLERAGLGLVMGNADPQMLALGLPVLPTNDEDGVAIAVERYLLAG
jgi:Cof subfamily protein (haloacid dehalogenase superfamily)